ncbi:ABC transporter ATP-binding protein [Halodurantibacterium flavum]|uniref:ABC transporter ATP-binding protein n=1 Tax=Halodurantibacterium flavum TaxID=1382802 RepID=A0ABW4S3C5_9RHOB
MGFLDISNLQKSFGATQVVKDFNLSVEKGEFISFLGPSGCGKTTTLRMVAGFEVPSAGTIRIDGRDVVRLRPNQRNIGMVFQSYALFPNLTVADNVGFGLRVAGVPRTDRAERVAEMLAIVGLADFGARYPFQLSGGQQQRVALARALAVRPQVLLLDEPLSALDAKIRVSLREEIRAIQRKLGITTIYVTHDQEEALSMSDRIVVMNNGVADQVGAPFDIYNRPATRFVASFVGTLNLLDVRVVDAGAGTVSLGGTTVPLGRQLRGDKVTLALRPEAVGLAPSDGRTLGVEGRIAEVHFLGSVIRIRVRVGDARISLDTFNSADHPPPQVGDPATVWLNPRDLMVLAD